MRVLVTILGIVSAILGLALSILPFGNIALIPIILAFIFGVIAFTYAKKEGKSRSAVKMIFLITIAALAVTIYRAIFDENIVEDTQESIERDQKSEEEAIQELDSLIIEE